MYDRKEYQKKYREKNKNGIKEYMKNYREKNKAELKQKRDEQYKKNKDRINQERKRKYKENHKENLNKIRNYVNRHRVDYWAINTIADHKKKGYFINFSKHELKELTRISTNCFYCDKALDFNGRKGRGPKANSPTLDRIDNQKILDIESIRIICYPCNKSKGDKTHKEFIDYCTMISEEFLRR